MSTLMSDPGIPVTRDLLAKLRQHYGCGPVDFTGHPNALYERHLYFDNVVDATAAGARERFEAFARSVRDVLSQRWVRTNDTYQRENPKRVYYLSMEFLIGRSLANNVTNLMLDPVVSQVAKEKNLDWLSLLEQEPDAGLGNGGLGRLAACFLDSKVSVTITWPASFGHCRSQACERPEPEHSDRAGAAAHTASHFLVGQPFHVAQDDDFAVLLRQAGQHFRETKFLLVLGRPLTRRRAEIGESVVQLHG